MIPPASITSHSHPFTWIPRIVARREARNTPARKPAEAMASFSKKYASNAPSKPTPKAMTKVTQAGLIFKYSVAKS